MFTLGGAHAIAALAYGTATIPQVDKIVGPGNAFVTEAKRRVFGIVGIDMLAGPSEILVIGDGTVDADWIAMDLFAQAEHDELAQALLLSPDAGFHRSVAASMQRQLQEFPRRSIISASLSGRGALIMSKTSMKPAQSPTRSHPSIWSSRLQSPSVGCQDQTRQAQFFLASIARRPWATIAPARIRAPHSRSARFSSPLGVYDFQKRTSIIHLSHAGAQTLGPIAATLAQGEGLQAHAKSAEYRSQA